MHFINTVFTSPFHMTLIGIIVLLTMYLLLFKWIHPPSEETERVLEIIHEGEMYIDDECGIVICIFEHESNKLEVSWYSGMARRYCALNGRRLYLRGFNQLTWVYGTAKQRYSENQAPVWK